MTFPVEPTTALAWGAGALLALSAALLCRAQDSKPASAPARDDTAAERLGWRLGVQAWTFRDRTTFEAVATAARFGIKYIELYPGQKLSPRHSDVVVGVGMPAEALADLRAELARHRVTAVSFGVVQPDRDEAKAQALFEFARSLGLETITAEPTADAFDILERLATHYGIAIALHDHPKPSPYWSPQLVLEAIEGRGKLLGACADTGHWVRSGLVPVECLKMLEGRVLTLHFKDIKGGIDRPWGLGAGNARGMLEELARQGFRGVISVEYEHGKGEPLERDVARCIAFFDAAAREIAARLKR